MGTQLIGQIRGLIKDRAKLQAFAGKQSKEVRKMITTDLNKVKAFLEKERKELEKIQKNIPQEFKKLRKFVDGQKKEIRKMMKQIKADGFKSVTTGVKKRLTQVTKTKARRARKTSTSTGAKSDQGSHSA